MNNTNPALPGYVVDQFNHKVPQAHLRAGPYSSLSDEGGVYWLPLPPGEHVVNVSAPGYVATTKLIVVHPGEATAQIVMLSIVKDNKILGLPRLVFLIIACEFPCCGCYATLNTSDSL